MSPPIKAFLIDDQLLLGEAVKRMIEGEEIAFWHCVDPRKAIEMAQEFSPTVLLVAQMALVQWLKENPATRDIPIVVLSSHEESGIKAEAFAKGASDYIVKLPEKEELIARLRYHSQGYASLLKLKESEAALQRELDEAARYVVSILPEKTDQTVRTDWAYIPSFRLGGDIFDYYFVDEDHFLFYFLDVCGHGVGTALLSIQLRNILRMPEYFRASLLKPNELLKELNERYQMEAHHDLYFTIWVGVYEPKTKTLTYSSGGHPSPLLFRPGRGVEKLSSGGMVVGGIPEQEYPVTTVRLFPGDKILLFSDGSYEFNDPSGRPQGYSDFVSFLEKVKEEPLLPAILRRAESLAGAPPFEDDFSLLQVEIKLES